MRKFSKDDVVVALRHFGLSAAVAACAYAVLRLIQGDPVANRARHARGICPIAYWDGASPVYQCNPAQRQAAIDAAAHSMTLTSIVWGLTAGVVVFAMLRGGYHTQQVALRRHAERKQERVRARPRPSTYRAPVQNHSPRPRPEGHPVWDGRPPTGGGGVAKRP